MSKQFTFFQNATANGTSPSYNVEDGGYRVIKATGIFGGATVTIEVDFADEDYAPIQAYQFTDEDVKEIQPLKPGIRIRAVLSGATGTTNVSVKIL